MPHTSRNSSLVPGVSRLSRSQVYAKRALYKRKQLTGNKVEKKVAITKTVPVKGDKNGKERVVPVNKAPKFYPAEDVIRRAKANKVAKPAKLRSTITPGTVLILLAGRFRGRRVVFLKQLESGLLLVTGPFKVNGVPVRRVNQAFVIATSTKIDISGVKVDEKLNDNYFKYDKATALKGTEEEFFGDKATKKPEIATSRVADQKALDEQLLSIVAKVPTLRAYLSSLFSLSKGQAPHLMKF